MEAARAPRPDEIGRIAELHRQAVTAVATERGGAVFGARETTGEPLEDWLQSRLADGGLWAGTVAESVVGYAVVAREELRDGSILGRIEAIYVEPEARGVGLGAALMQSVLAWADETGCGGIDAWALPGDRHTKNFFEANAFSARLLVMHKKEIGGG